MSEGIRVRFVKNEEVVLQQRWPYAERKTARDFAHEAHEMATYITSLGRSVPDYDEIAVDIDGLLSAFSRSDLEAMPSSLPALIARRMKVGGQGV